jgi:thiol-disulfide isomerase/thioredoxin
MDAETDKQVFARYYLAEAYKASGDIDRAKSEYNLLVEKYYDVNPRIGEMAKRSLANLKFDKQLAIGKEPIDFNVVGLNGEAISPGKYKGKVLLLDFWATWCVPCRREMPNVKRVYKKYSGKGFEIVGISLDQNRADLDKYIKSNEISWPQFYDGKYWQNDVAIKYGIQSIPATYLIDKKGKIRYKTLRGKKLETAVKQLLDE